jgi:hypothetical protein
MRKLLIIGLLAVLLTFGCSRIHEPWVQSDDQLARERARSAEQTLELQIRLLRVQTDR